MSMMELLTIPGMSSGRDLDLMLAESRSRMKLSASRRAVGLAMMNSSKARKASTSKRKR